MSVEEHETLHGMLRRLSKQMDDLHWLAEACAEALIRLGSRFGDNMHDVYMRLRDVQKTFKTPKKN